MRPAFTSSSLAKKIENMRTFQKPIVTEYAVMVLNIAFRANWKDLREHFSVAGKVTFAHIVKKNGLSAGYGIVKYRTESESSNAISMLNNTLLKGRPLRVENYKEDKLNYYGELTTNIIDVDFKKED